MAGTTAPAVFDRAQIGDVNTLPSVYYPWRFHFGDDLGQFTNLSDSHGGCHTHYSDPYTLTAAYRARKRSTHSLLRLASLN